VLVQIALCTHAALAYQLVIICLQWRLLAFMVPHCMREAGVSGAIILIIQLLLVLSKRKSLLFISFAFGLKI
jgi:hypothetical protein